MKTIIKNNILTIALTISLLSFFKSCSDSRHLSKIEKDIKSIKDSAYTKTEFQKELEIMGLEAEHRMIESTDRKMLDLTRQDSIRKAIKELKSQR
jgi:hypothetical protein